MLLPFHREGEWLREAAESILQQTHSDFELLLLESRADDLTAQTAKNLAQADQRIRLLPVDEQGIAHALNKGWKLARGKYIARMDADDIAHPERLSKQHHHLQANSDIQVVSCQTTLFPSGSDNEGYEYYVSWQNKIISAEDHSLNRFVESPVAHPSVMIRKSAVERLGIYSTGPVPEDYELWLRWMQEGIRFEKIPETLHYWRDHDNRLSRTHPHYSEESFFRIKAKYLAAWLKENVQPNRPLMACGSSKKIRSRIDTLRQEGVMISAVTDVMEHRGHGLTFYPAKDLEPSNGHFIISLISKRDVRDSIEELLQKRGFSKGADYILAG